MSLHVPFCDGYQDCTDCGGAGIVCWFDADDIEQETTCEICRGTGEIACDGCKPGSTPPKPPERPER